MGSKRKGHWRLALETANRWKPTAAEKSIEGHKFEERPNKPALFVNDERARDMDARVYVYADA